MGRQRGADLQGLRLPGDRRVLGRTSCPTASRPISRRAVAAQPGEKIVFTWQVWPDKESFYAAEARMHEDARMDTAGEPPFDARRLILGCFQPIFTMGRD
ncbi:MAG: DUF1428 family protein [Caulobacteraceae bacterium]